MKLLSLALVCLLLLDGCADQTAPKVAIGPAPTSASKAPPAKQVSFAEARKGFTTKIVRKSAPGDPIVAAPSAIFRNVTYTSPAGKLKAYLSPDPKDGKKHPAIVWIFAGLITTSATSRGRRPSRRTINQPRPSARRAFS